MCVNFEDKYISAYFVSKGFTRVKRYYQGIGFLFIVTIFYLRLHRSRSGQVMFHPCILLDWIDHK